MRSDDGVGGDGMGQDGLRQLLRRARTIAIVGLSADWNRPSHFAAKYMQQAGYRIVPVNPRYAGQTVLGVPCVATLEEIGEHVDIVDVFRRTEDVLPLARSAGAHWNITRNISLEIIIPLIPGQASQWIDISTSVASI